MTVPINPALDEEAEYADALPQRLRAAAAVLLESAPDPLDGDPYEDAGVLLGLLVANVRAHPGDGRLWLLLVALTGEFPLHDDVEQARRMLELNTAADGEHLLLEQCAQSAGMGLLRTIRIITDRPVVDVDFSARHDLMTGIQRVVRQTVPRWQRVSPIELCAWTLEGGAQRELSQAESAYFLGAEPHATPHRELDDHDGSRVIVPWHVPVVLPEVPAIEHVPRLVALARHSGSTLRLVGYDCIPVISADLVESHEHGKFIAYLNVVKSAETIACISESAAEEFAGYVDMISAQGLRGPQIVACVLPNGADIGLSADLRGPDPTWSAVPTVACVGSIDRRKNQIVALEAAERLWRDGLRFRLRFLGSGGVAPPDFTRWADELILKGRLLTIESGVSDAHLRDAIRSARFTVFVSLHEGYGLPIAESLTLGVPVVASDLGSMREIAADDGAILVDPRSIDDVTAAMRDLLTDDTLLGTLRQRARTRSRRSWDDYAAEVWSVLVSPG